MYSSTSKRPNRSGSSGFSSSTTTAMFSSPAASFGGRESSARRTCSSNGATSVRRPQGLAFRDEENGRDPEDEAADVCEEGDTAAGLGLHERPAALPELEQEPHAEEEDGRKLLEEDQDDEDRREHASVRQQDEIRPEDGRDRPARSNVRDARVLDRAEVQRDEGLHDRGRESARDVPQEEPDLAERVLDVVAEDP